MMQNDAICDTNYDPLELSLSGILKFSTGEPFMSVPPKLYLSKRSNGIYHIRIQYENGYTNWKTTKCKTKSAALSFLNSFQIELSLQSEINIPHLSEYLKLFETVNKSNLRKRTMDAYINYGTMLMNSLGDKPINKYLSTEFERFRADKIGTGWSITSANIFTRSIKAVFSWAVRQNIIEINPFHKIKVLKQARRAPSFLTLDELRAVLKCVSNSTLKDMFIFTAYTGLRLAEVVNMRMDSVDLINNRIHVSNSDKFTTKSGRERVIGLHSCLVDVILRQKECDYLFSKDNGYKFTESYVSHKFKQAFIKANISKNIHFHSLRHTFASWAVQNGVDIYTVQALLGHSSVATTSIYSHLEQSNLQSAVSKLPS
jgi:site-specific recombinase XerD